MFSCITKSSSQLAMYHIGGCLFFTAILVTISSAKHIHPISGSNSSGSIKEYKKQYGDNVDMLPNFQDSYLEMIKNCKNRGRSSSSTSESSSSSSSDDQIVHHHHHSDINYHLSPAFKHHKTQGYAKVPGPAPKNGGDEYNATRDMRQIVNKVSGLTAFLPPDQATPHNMRVPQTYLYQLPNMNKQHHLTKRA